MAQFIQVLEDVNDEPIEIPSEDDGTLLLTTLMAQFPSACGLKYKSETGAYRGIRLADGVLYPPDGLWGNHQYIAVFPKSELSENLVLCIRLKFQKVVTKSFAVQLTYFSTRVISFCMLSDIFCPFHRWIV